MHKITLTLCFILSLSSVESYAQSAPVAAAGNVISYGPTATVAITVDNLIDVGSCNLKLLYDPLVLTATGVAKNPSLPGNLASNIATPGILSLGWYTYPAATLPDGSEIFTITFTQNVPGYSSVAFDNTGNACAWSDANFDYLDDLPTSDYYIDGSVDGRMYLNLKTFLEGPFEDKTMSSALNPLHIPLAQPYNGDPWNYPGIESFDAIPNADVVDWVLVELRETTGDAASAAPATTVARHAALILKNGAIVSTDGSGKLAMKTFIYDNLYAVVWHRNHLGIMSAQPLVLTGDTWTYNFSTALNKAYLSGQKDLGSGIFGLYAGDADKSGSVTSEDMDLLWKNEAGKNGYFDSDVNLDGQADNQDKNDTWLENLNKQSQVPD